MTEAVQVALIVAIPQALISIAGIIISRSTRTAVKEVHVQFNGRMDELIRLKGQSEHAKGVKEEKAKHKP